MFRVKHFDAIDVRAKRHASGAARYEAGFGPSEIARKYLGFGLVFETGF
jgi:hypothetical protein